MVENQSLLEETSPQLPTKGLKQEVANAIGDNGIADSILASFNKLANQGQLVFPKNYSVGNQLKLMYSTIEQSGNLQSCTAISVGQSMAEAVIQGLEIDKKQVYFIKRANKLTMFRSYFGDIAASKRSELIKDIRARVVYEGDTFELGEDEVGDLIVVKHETSLKNMDNAIQGAYSWAIYPDGTTKYCVMTWKEIQTNWNKSSNPSGSVQKDFPQEMAKRTVIRRLTKMIFNTASTDISDASKAVIASFNRTTEAEYDNSSDGVNNIITDENGEVIGR